MSKRGRAPSATFPATPNGLSEESRPSTSSQRPRKKVRRREGIDHFASATAGAEDGGGGGGQDTSWPMQPGMIQEIRLKNFMCHQEFAYVPNQRLNFLCGENGSGKSAVLSAVVFALGGTARATNRGSSNKDLVRKGQRSASVSVKLYNGGDDNDAFRPEVYGASITIVRTVAAEGSSGGYKFLDNRGQPVPQKRPREELDKMLDAFRIQINNPIAILNQDDAKTFLFKCDPARLYEFFSKATLLDECKKEHAAAVEERARAVNLLEEKCGHLPALEEEVDRWSRKMELHQTIMDRAKEVKAKKNELLWALEGKALAYLKTSLAEEDKWRRKMVAVAEKQRKEEDAATILRTEKEEAERKIQQFADSAKEAFDEVDRLRKLRAESGNKERAAKKAAAEARSARDKRQAEVDELAAEILRQRERGTSDYEERERAREREVEALEKAARNSESQMQAQQTHKSNLKRSLEQAREEEHGLTAQKNAIRSQADSKRRELQNLKGQKNKFAVYGPDMAKLVSAMRGASSSFGKMPIGPLGSHVSLKTTATAEQAVGIERELGPRLLHSFIVDNFKDRQTLDALQKKVGMQQHVNIFVAEYAENEYDVSSGRTSHPDFPTIYDLIEVDDPTVMNCLLDQKGIEQILMVNTDRDAQALLGDVGSVPKNCQMAISGQGYQFLPAPNYRSYAISTNLKNNKILSPNLADLVRALEEELESLAEEARALGPKEEELKESRQRATAEVAKAERTIAKIQDDIKEKNKKIGLLRNESSAEKPVNVEALEDDLDRIREELAELERVLGQAEEAHTEAKEEFERARKVHEERKREAEERDGETGPLEKRVEEAEVRAERHITNAKHYAKKRDEYETSLRAAGKDVAERRLMHEQRLEAAGRKSERPVEGRLGSCAEIERELTRLEGMNRLQESSQEPLPEVLAQLRHYSRLQKGVAADLRQIEDQSARLGDMLALRQESFVLIRDSIARRVQTSFALCLSTRRFSGSLSFDHQRQRLEIAVDPEGGANAASSSSVRSMRTLSGGEKSYSTISLVLALWNVMSPPFRFLDEFDVFMDMVNRRLALDQIVDHVERTRRHQYVLLTPLNTEGIKIGPDLRVTKLEKNQD